MFGGSVAEGFEVHGGADPIVARIAALAGVAGKTVHVGTVALGGFKQPQQLLALAYLLSLGFHIDVVINLDGYNEASLGPTENVPRDVATFFPRLWSLRIQDAPNRPRLEMLGELQILRRRREKWAQALDRPPLRWSATASLAWKIEDRRLERDISWRERAMVEDAPKKRGWIVAPPRPTTRKREDLLPEVVATWREGSLQMDRLARANGARYFHFLQPNQYVPGSKPMDEAERVLAVRDGNEFGKWVRLAYPAMIDSGSALRAAGVRFFDLTRAFADRQEPLYVDDCCHFNNLGYQILGARMAEAIAETW